MLAVGALGASATRVHAQSNYRLAPVGGRTTLVGGTGVVYGHDGASAFLNPATAVRIDDDRLSFSVNFYSMSLVSAPRWYRPGIVDEKTFGPVDSSDATMTDLEFNALPSSLCFFFRMADIPLLKGEAKEDIRLRAARFGLCFASVQSQTFNFAAESRSQVGPAGVLHQAQTLSQSYTRFSFGPTYAMYITDRLALGASLHASFASHRGALDGAATSYGGGRRPVGSFLYSAARGDSFQLTGTVGLTYRYHEQTFGLVVESPSLHIYGVGSANYYTHFEGAGQLTSTTQMTGSFASRSPTRISLGTGIEKKWGSAELNVSYYAPMSRAFTANLNGNVVQMSGETISDQETGVSVSQGTRGVVNIGLGGEVFILPKLSVLGGVSTDLSAIRQGALTPDLINYYPSRNNRYSASLGVGSHGEGGNLLVGTEFAFSGGDRLAVNSFKTPPDVDTAPHATFQLLFVIAGSTSLLALKRAYKDVKEVISQPEKARQQAPEHAPLDDTHPIADQTKPPPAPDPSAEEPKDREPPPPVAPPEPPPPIPTHPIPAKPKPRAPRP